MPLRFGKNGPRASLLGCSATGYGIVVAIVLVVGAPCAFIGGTLCSPVLHSTVARRCNMSASDADLDKPAHAVVIHISAHNTHTARACTRALAERACKTIASCLENMAGLCVCSVIHVAMFACETIARSPHTAPPHCRTLRYCRRLPQCGARPPVPQRPERTPPAGRVMERIGMKKMLLVLYAVWFIIGLVTVSPSAREPRQRRIAQSSRVGSVVGAPLGLFLVWAGATRRCLRGCARSRASCATNRSAVGALMPMIYGANDPNKGTNCPNKGANNPNKGHCAAKH